MSVNHNVRTYFGTTLVQVYPVYSGLGEGNTMKHEQPQGIVYLCMLSDLHRQLCKVMYFYWSKLRCRMKRSATAVSGGPNRFLSDSAITTQGAVVFCREPK